MSKRLLFIACFLLPLMVEAQDWAQWGGANRDAVVKATNLNLDWTDSKPALLWTFRQAGAGYSSPSISGTTLYCQGAANGKDFAFAIDTKTGALKWKQDLGAEYVQDRGNGPRGAVTVDGDRLYLIRGGGQIHCLQAADGKMLWQKDFTSDFGGELQSRWGFSESPLVEGNLVVCTPGGNSGTLAALDKNTGAVVWRSKEWTDIAGYSSPIVAVVDGVKQIIQIAKSGVAGVSVNDGKLLWKADVAGNKTAVIPSPIYSDKDHIVFVTSGYGAGCAGVKLTKSGDVFKAETLYENKNMTNHHGGVVLVGDNIYGFSDTGGWTCQSLKSGEVVWKERPREPGKGAVICVNNRLLCLSERTGTITLASATTDGWKESGNLEIPERTKIETTDNMVWTHPVVADNKLYMRDHDLLFCFDLKK